jgi:hypothetical protein
MAMPTQACAHLSRRRGEDLSLKRLATRAQLRRRVATPRRIWAWFGYGLGMVWVWFGYGLGMVWVWFKHGLGMVWVYFGSGLGMVWLWFGHGLGMVWLGFG